MNCYQQVSSSKQLFLDLAFHWGKSYILNKDITSKVKCAKEKSRHCRHHDGVQFSDNFRKTPRNARNIKSNSAYGFVFFISYNCTY